MTTLSIDFETRSTVELPKTGVYVYAAHESTAIWCMAWAFDDEEPEILFPEDTVLGPGQALPQRILDHIAAGGRLRAHNANFERIMWRDCGRRRYGWPEIQLGQWECSAAEAAAMALPRSLGKAAHVLGVPFQKDEEGHRLMLRMCRPRSTKGGEVIWWDVAPRLERLGEYCRQDVRAEQSISKVLRRLSASEREVYLLDQRVNDRGILLDVPLAHAARAITEDGLERSADLLERATGGVVSSVTQVGRLKAWLEEQGVPVTALDKESVGELLAQAEMLPQVRMALEARKDFGRSSVAKINAMLAGRCADDAMRGLLLYHGATTGRWAGMRVQPHNFPRGDGIDDPESFIPDVLARDYDAIDLVYPPLELVAGLLRGMMIARPGYRLMAADYSGIEFRTINWLAGQEDVLDVIRSGRDQYRVNASQMFGVPYDEVTKQQRQGGKAVELGCGFGMGWKKFQATAAKAPYFLTLTDEEAQGYVRFYRESHDKVKQFWYDLEGAALRAVRAPGSLQHAGRLTYMAAGPLLWCKLPSGRLLCYPGARVIERETPWGELRPAVQYYTTHAITKQWTAVDLYGGLLAENVTQAVARDVMVDGMRAVEAAGYPVVLTVHDEIVTEPVNGHGSVTDFTQLLQLVPEWAGGLPVEVEAWEAGRYRK